MSLRLTFGRASAGLRRVSARHPWMRWVPITTCAVGLVMTAHAYSADADATRDAWGELRSVWVASHDIEPGASIDAALTRLPVAAVPESAVDGESPVGRIATQRVGAGEVVTSSDVGDAGELALLPADWRGVAVSESPTSGATLGDRVDVVSEGVVLVGDAIVVAHLDDSVLIGVPADRAPLVALATETGVSLLRTGRTGRSAD